MTLDTSITYFANLFEHTGIFGIGGGFILGLGIVFLSSILISPHKFANIKLLIFPLMLGYKIIGFNIPLVFIGISGILFVIETLSIQFIQSTIEAIKSPLTLREEYLENKLAKLARRESLEKKSKLRALEQKGIGFFGKLTKDQIKTIEEKHRQNIPKISNLMPYQTMNIKGNKKLKKRTTTWEMDE